MNKVSRISQPVWFYYDKDGEKLLITTSKSAKKTQNLRNKPTIYFSIDDENLPYKGVKGRGIATMVEAQLQHKTRDFLIHSKYQRYVIKSNGKSFLINVLKKKLLVD